MENQNEKYVPTATQIKPVLWELMKEHGELDVNTVKELIAQKFQLPDFVLKLNVKGSNRDSLFYNRIRWAKLSLQNEGKVFSKRRGLWSLVQYLNVSSS